MQENMDFTLLNNNMNLNAAKYYVDKYIYPLSYNIGFAVRITEQTIVIMDKNTLSLMILSRIKNQDVVNHIICNANVFDIVDEFGKYKLYNNRGLPVELLPFDDILLNTYEINKYGPIVLKRTTNATEFI